MRRRLLPYLPPALLVLVAATQFTVAQTSTLSPWKLGGFGMFSTPNNGGSRVLRVTLETDEGLFVVPGPSGSLSTLTWPRRSLLRQTARSAACGRWRFVPMDSLETVVFPSPEWKLLYSLPAIQEMTHLAGFAVAEDAPEGAPGAGVRSAQVTVDWIRLDAVDGETMLGPAPLTAEVVTPADANCAPLP